MKIKFYYWLQGVFGWLEWRMSQVERFAAERREHLAWHYWETHPEEKARVERIADEVVADMRRDYWQRKSECNCGSIQCSVCQA